MVTTSSSCGVHMDTNLFLFLCAIPDIQDWQQWRGWRVRESTTSMVAITGRPCAQQQQQQQRRAMSFWTEFAKAFKERAESSKELTESMAELKKLQEAENLKKTKESMEKIKDKSFEGLSQIKNIVSGSKSGEVTTEKMSGTVVTKLEELRSKLNQSNASEKAQNSNDASDQASLNAHDRVSGIFSSIGGVLVRSATSTTKTTDDNPALEAPTTQEKEVDEVVATEERKPEAPVVLKSTRLQTAAEGRMQAVTNRLRSTSAYKNALALREKLVESDNPLIQRALDVSDSVFRFTSKLFSENDYAKTIKLIHSLDPTFSTEQFKQQMVSSFVPTLRKALLRGESGPISALMSKRLAEHELEVLREIESRGYRLQSRLLNLDNVEVRCLYFPLTLAWENSISLINGRPILDFECSYQRRRATNTDHTLCFSREPLCS